MSDLEAVIAGLIWIAVGIVWSFTIFLPRIRRLRQRYGWPPPQAPMGAQLRFVGSIVLGALAVMGLAGLMTVGLGLPGLIAASLLFYGFLTLVLVASERQVRNAARGAREWTSPAQR
jgi:hypothetical protein